MAADREFYKLQLEYDKKIPDSQEARRFLEGQLEKCSKEEVVADLSDFKDWAKIAPCYGLYKLCRVMLEENIEDFVTWTEDSLRNVISCCLAKLPDMLVKQCWKWAQEFEEDKLWEAIHLAGKCRGVLQPKSTVNTTQKCTVEVEELSNQGVSTATS
ncbi:hypothetical protein SUGI_0788460 [Cryptomeria japonica]|nr:hypothetical protein SUGI_0788460 [Cryptomeria japonica]